MKRRLLLHFGPFLLLGGVILTAQAEKRISITQLEQAATQLKGVSDSEAAQRLADLQLTERISERNFTVLAQAVPGEKSRQALRAIADQSQFLRPPTDETPSNPVPSLAEQRRVMGLVAAYVRSSIPQLPNFFATRITDHFEDTPQLQRAELSFRPYQPLHFLSRSEAAVFYQGGREVVDVKGRAGRPKPSSEGLNTWGVFGPILGTVLVDAASSKLAWGHWESGATGPVAVFEFDVPQQKSHYEVNYCCYVTQAGSSVADVHPFRRIVPYHGSMTVDPASGIVQRLVVEAELKPTDPVTKASILVDYGPVEIGGKTYTCPIRSLSNTVAQTVQADPVYKYAVANQLQPLKTSLNDVAFESYHMFRSDMRVLTPEEADLVQQAQVAAPALSSAALPPVAGSAQSASATGTVPSEAKPESAVVPGSSEPKPEPATTSAVSNISSVAPVSKAEEPVSSEITTTAATELPDIPGASTPAPADTGYRLRTTSRLVEVTVVAFDKKGHPITNLKPADFEIYDNGRKQTVNSLTQAGGETASTIPTATKPATGEHIFTNRPVDAPPTAGASSQRISTNTTIFLIDSSHVAFADLTHARSEILRFLKTVPADEPVALYVLRKYGFEVLNEPTIDHAEMAATLTKWMPSAQDLSQSANEESRNRQQMEYVHSKYDLPKVNGHLSTGEEEVMSPPDIQLRSLGDSPGQDALQYLVWVARHVAAFKGHKSLIWVASDNVLADFSEKAPLVERGDKYLDPLSLKAREALNEAQVSIYPLDTSQLESNVVGANLQHANVQVTPTAPDLPQTGALGSGGTGPGGNDEFEQLRQKAQRDINPGRLTAQLQQDTHPIQGTFRELAEATGGRALRRASDIAAELDSIVNDGRAAYTLGFTPDTAADDAYHHLAVKLSARRDVTLRYRTGYLYDKEPATLKQRFQNAVWRPADLSEISLSAEAVRDANPPAVKVNVATADLALAQQGGLWMDKLDIFLVQRDDALFHAKLDGQTLGLRLKPSTYQQVLKDGININEPIKTLPDTGALRIIVIDENSGRIGTLTLPASALKQKHEN